MDRSPALAMAFSLWTRHRWEITSGLATLVAAIATYPLLFSLGRDKGVLVEGIVIVSAVPLLIVATLFMNLLLFCDEVGNPASGYPRRSFVLPVPTRTLVVWPMLYGAGVVALLWLATAVLIYRPAGFALPVLLPALGLAAMMAWLQALAWSPFANHWVRSTLTTGVLIALTAFPLGIKAMGWASDPAIAALFVAYLPAAYALAMAGVASDRQGETWRLWPGADSAAPQRTAGSGRQPRAFRTPAEAQLWYEWRCHGLIVPVAMAPAVVAILATMLVFHSPIARGSSQSRFIIAILAINGLAMPAFIASFLGPNIARMAPMWSKPRTPLAFVAIRPMITRDLVAAKFRMAAWSTLLSSAVATVGMGLTLIAMGLTADVVDLGREFLGIYPGWRAVAIVALGAVTVLTLTWKQMTDAVAAGLTGRRWIAEGAVLPIVLGLLGIVVIKDWLDLRALAAVPVLIGLVLALKGMTAAWAFRACVRRGLLGPSAALVALAAWSAMVAGAAGLVVLASPAGGLPVTRFVVLLGCAAVMPLGRFALAPLALDWNRHR